MKPGQTFRELGCEIGAKVRFVDDKPDEIRVITTEAQLDYRWLLPWVVIKASPSRGEQKEGAA